jgi:hypothetical protein
MANKKTVVEMYTEIMAVEGLTDEQREFLAKRIELTEKKNAKSANKPTAQQIANEITKQTIVQVLGELATPSTIGDMQKHSAELNDLSNQRISALLTQLVKAEQVERTMVKGKAHFALPSAEN